MQRKGAGLPADGSHLSVAPFHTTRWRAAAQPRRHASIWPAASPMQASSTHLARPLAGHVSWNITDAQHGVTLVLEPLQSAVDGSVLVLQRGNLVSDGVQRRIIFVPYLALGVLGRC